MPSTQAYSRPHVNTGTCIFEVEAKVLDQSHVSLHHLHHRVHDHRGTALDVGQDVGVGVRLVVDELRVKSIMYTLAKRHVYDL